MSKVTVVFESEEDFAEALGLAAGEYTSAQDAARKTWDRFGIAYKIVPERDLTLELVAERVGERGEVHDIYALHANGVLVAELYHYIEYPLEEAPVTYIEMTHEIPTGEFVSLFTHENEEGD